MGADKATIHWRGRPLWEWQLGKLRELQPAKIFLSARANPTWRPTDVEFVADAPPSRGPLSGLTAALARTESEHLLTLAIDLPAMTVGHLRYLRALIVPGVGVVPVIDGRAEPFAAIYPREACVESAEALIGTNASLQPLIGQLIASQKMRTIEIRPADEAFYKNVNRPGDLAE